MKDELNNYNIANSDGISPRCDNDGKVAFDNDASDYIHEDAKSKQPEFSGVSEAFDDSPAVSEEEGSSGNMETSLSSSSSAASASASAGGGVGALAGVVASSVAAAVVVVAVFLSTLAISLSLVIADMHSLVFGVTMTGAQEEDFKTPIYAVLTSDDGTHLEQEVKQDTVLLTFDDLEPGREYRLIVKNEQKVFDEITCFTTTEPNQKGEIVSSMRGNDVFVTVRKADLKASEHYTLVAKDAQGNTVFSKDGVEPFAEYTFKVDKPKALYFYLMVGDKTYAISQIELPDYDFDSGVWTWSEDFSGATVSFADKKGGAPLVLTATVTRKSTEPTCDKDGSLAYTAKAVHEGKTYTQTETVVLESLGHNYLAVYEDGEITYTCSRCGDTYTNKD